MSKHIPGLRCSGCHGSGKIMSGGFVYTDHADCNGTGKLTDHELIIRQKLLQNYKDLSEEDANSLAKEALAEVKNGNLAESNPDILATESSIDPSIVAPKRKPGRPKMRIV